MAKDALDARKLKDSVAEYLKKSKFEKAAEVLEQLVKMEPKEMQHRLRLGDCYRRLADDGKSIDEYEAAARFFADQGQLIKGIAAVKIILEIDPDNEDAQEQLAEMNDARLGARVTKAGPGVVTPKELSPVAPSTGAIELEEDEPAARSLGAAIRRHVEPIELEDDEPERPLTEKVPPARTRGAQRGAMADKAKPQTGLEPEEDEALELDDAPRTFRAGRKAVIPPPPVTGEIAVDLGSDSEVEELPDEAILAPGPEKLAASPDDERVVEDELELAKPPPRPKKAAAPARKPSAPAAIELSLEPARPIADLLSSDAEEEIELLSVSSDAGREPEPPEATGKDIEDAFGAIAPASKRKVPARVPLFDDLSQDAFVELVNKLSYRRYAAGVQILAEGDPGRSFFVIVEGKVRIWKKLADGQELQLATLGEGAFFGEMALLSGAPRTANVSAEEDTELLEVTDTLLRDLTRKHPQVGHSLKNFYRQRLLNNVMAISPLFKDFDPSERRQIVEKFKLRQAAPGEMIIKEGKASDGLYVVLHGAVDVAAQQIDLARLKEGDIFGEMSLLTRKPATATVTSPGNSILLKLPRESFQELVVTHPQILALVSQLTEERAAATRAALEQHGIDSFV